MLAVAGLADLGTVPMWCTVGSQQRQGAHSRAKDLAACQHLTAHRNGGGHEATT